MMSWLEPRYLAWLWQGFVITLLLAASSGLAATAFGFVLAVAGDLRSGVLRTGVATYVLVFRNAPLLIQLLFWYFGAASVLPDALMIWLNTPRSLDIGALSLPFPSFEALASWLALSAYSSAFICEEFRAGMRGVALAQRQAAAALGLNAVQALRHVVLPQAVRIATPALFGQYMNLVKNSSLAMAVGLAELSYQMRAVESATFKTFQTYGVATLLYVGSIALLEVALQAIQHRRRTARSVTRS